MQKNVQKVIFGRKKGACGCSEQSTTLILIFFPTFDQILTKFDEKMQKNVQKVIFGRKKGACGCSEQSTTLIFIFFIFFPQVRSKFDQILMELILKFDVRIQFFYNFLLNCFIDLESIERWGHYRISLLFRLFVFIRTILTEPSNRLTDSPFFACMSTTNQAPISTNNSFCCFIIIFISFVVLSVVFIPIY